MAFVQGSGSSAHWNGVNTATTAATFSAPVGSGHLVHGHIIFDGALAGATLSSVTDDKGNTYTLGLSVTVPSGGDIGFTLQTFRHWNTTNGPVTITATLSANSDFTAIEIAEYSGIQTSADPKDVEEGLWQSSVSAATNALESSASGTSTGTACLIVGNLCDIDEHISSVTAGTSPQTATMNHTQQSPAPASLLYTESYVQGAAAAARATFTNSTGSFNTIAIMTAYKIAAGSPYTLTAATGSYVLTGKAVRFKYRKTALSALYTLLDGMAANSFKQLTLTSEHTAMANALPRTKVNFDSNGSTWTSDAAVAANTMSGVGAANNTPEIFAFSTPAISSVDGNLSYQGGGHTDSGDGSVYTFNVIAAAANINGGGSGTTWTMAIPSPMYIDAFTHTRPSSGSSPVGAIQGAPTTPTGANQGYWTMPNKNGVAMPIAGHTYYAHQAKPGTTEVLISGTYGYDANASTNSHTSFVFDSSAVSMTMLTSTAGFPTSGSQAEGYCGGDNNGNIYASPYNPVDGNFYTIQRLAFSWNLYYWTNADNSSLALNDSGASTGSSNTTPVVNRDLIIVRDPSNSSRAIMFQHSAGVASPTDGDFLVVKDIGGTPAFEHHTYGTGSVTTNGAGWCTFADAMANRGVIAMSDGQNWFEITPDPGGNLSAWTIAQVTTPSGDTPPTPSAGSELPRIQYIPDADCYMHTFRGQVRVYKPLNWYYQQPSSPSLVAASATGVAAALAPSVQKSLAAVAATGAAAAMTPSIQVPLAAVSATGAAAALSLTISDNLTLTAVAATGAVAAMTVTAGTTINLAAVSATAAVAALVGRVDVALVAVAAAGAAGSLVEGVSAAMTGVAASGVAAALVPAVSVVLSAVSAIGAAATITAQGSATNIVLGAVAAIGAVASFLFPSAVAYLAHRMGTLNSNHRMRGPG